jgi:dolichol-phosphate mannosyltransferase
MEKEKDISIVIPIYNEEKNISELYKRLQRSITGFADRYEMIFVNDGSEDGSLSELKDLSKLDEQVYYINFSRNFGHQVAVSAGLEYCKGKCTVIIDGDLQDPPELINLLYEKHKEGFDVVYAKREHRDGESFLKKITSKIFYRILKRLTPFSIPLDTGDFRLLDNKVVKALNKMPEQNKYLRGQVAWLGFKQAYVLFNRKERGHGVSGYSYGKMLRLAIDAVTSFSDKPLSLVTRLGFIISFFSFLVILYSLFAYFVLKETVTGWASLIVSSMFIGGIQLFSVGIIG